MAEWNRVRSGVAGAVGALALIGAQAQSPPGNQARSDNVPIAIKRCPTTTNKVCEENVLVAPAPRWNSSLNGWDCSIAVEQGVLVYGIDIDKLTWILPTQSGAAQYVFRPKATAVDEPYGVYVYADAANTVFTPRSDGGGRFTLTINQRTGLAYAYGVYLDWVQTGQPTKRCLGLDPMIVNMD